MIDPNKICYIFDVDGTLTFPRQKIEQSFEREFFQWAKEKQLFIATGSDFDKTKQQVPQNIINCFKAVFCCMGNEMRAPNGNIIEKSNFVIPDDLDDDLQAILKNSQYPKKTGNHIEFRTGMINFSTVGRRANLKERKEYNQWDMNVGERQEIADFINENYPT